MEIFSKKTKGLRTKRETAKESRRKIERRNEKFKSADNTPESNPVTSESSVRQGQRYYSGVAHAVCTLFKSSLARRYLAISPVNFSLGPICIQF